MTKENNVISFKLQITLLNKVIILKRIYPELVNKDE